jgi:probable rRNA maturation factor
VIEIDLFIEAGTLWGPETRWQPLCEKAIFTTLGTTGLSSLVAGDGQFDMSIRLADDQTIRPLNHDTRRIDKATNVLSFQFLDASELKKLASLPAATLGDIVLAHETIAREAADQAKSHEDHTIHLVVHGLLHLLGYDHEQDADAEVMEALERRILADLGIADPYADPHFQVSA